MAKVKKTTPKKKEKKASPKKVEKKARCAAKTKTGTKCKRPASGRSKFCSAHKKK